MNYCFRRLVTWPAFELVTGLKMIFWFILTVVFITNGVKGDDICSKCLCKNGDVTCEALHLETVPDLLSVENCSTLILNENNIRNIKVFPPMKYLHTLSLRHNYIYTFEALSFFNLTSLHTLDLTHNMITSENLKPIIFKSHLGEGSYETLPVRVLKLGMNSLHTLNPDLFEYLNDVEELYLEKNPLRVIDHGTEIALSTLHKLRILNLAGTSLRMLPETMLHTPTKLEFLDLTGNEFTTVPSALQYSVNIKHLILSSNPIQTLESFPVINSLTILEMNLMMSLKKISSHALGNLINLSEFHCSENPYLTEIAPSVFEKEGNETESSLKKLIIRKNRLGYLEEKLYPRWDNLEELEIDQNPWICDCKNQWMVDTLLPIMKGQNKDINNLICTQPDEMKGRKFIELIEHEVNMRCLDLYGNHPEKDAKVLIIVLLGTLLAIPIALVVVGYLRKPMAFSSHYPRAYYKRAVSVESIPNSNNMNIFHT